MLTAVILIPLAAAFYLIRVPDGDRGKIKAVSISASLAAFLVSLAILSVFDPNHAEIQMVESFSWVSALNINFLLGVDGISIWLVVLTAFLSLIAIFSSLDQKKNLKVFMALMLALEAGTLGVFLALDTILFYVLWELMLVPTYFLIGLWGEGDRVYATTKFVLYTLVGSLLMLVGILAVTVMHYDATHHLTFDIRELMHTHIDASAQTWLFLFFFLAFAIKIPVFPLHSWLPHAYVSCPIPTLILLTGAMSKTGAYGLIRFCLPLFPEAVDMMGWFIGGLAATGMIYGAWIAIAQKDIKALVAYSSISHLGFIVLGIFALNGEGLEGSVLQMVNHGIIASALFLIVGMIEKKLGSRNLDDLRGLRNVMPILYGVFMLITLAALGLPGLNGFVGEFLILVGVWTSSGMNGYGGIYVLMGGLTIVFASIYMLYFFQGAMQEKNEKLSKDLTDINEKELGLLIPACILVIVIGVLPKPFMEQISPSAKHVLTIEKTVNLPKKGHGGGHH